MTIAFAAGGAGNGRAVLIPRLIIALRACAALLFLAGLLALIFIQNTVLCIAGVLACVWTVNIAGALQRRAGLDVVQWNEPENDK